MVHLGLSRDETLKSYRLLGHGKDFIFSPVESFAQSGMCLSFALKWLFLEPNSEQRVRDLS